MTHSHGSSRCVDNCHHRPITACKTSDGLKIERLENNEKEKHNATYAEEIPNTAQINGEKMAYGTSGTPHIMREREDLQHITTKKDCKQSN